MKDKTIIVILAGGKGSRLNEITKKIPKPLLVFQGKNALEVLLEKTQDLANCEVFVIGHYKYNVLAQYLHNHNQKVTIIKEQTPKGTGGALAEIMNINFDNLIFAYSDIFFTTSFKCLFDFYIEKKADMLLGTVKKHIETPYGIITKENDNVISFEEKIFEAEIFAGIAVVNRNVHNTIKWGNKFGFNAIISDAIRNKRLIKTFPIDNWYHLEQKDLKTLETENYVS